MEWDEEAACIPIEFGPVQGSAAQLQLRTRGHDNGRTFKRVAQQCLTGRHWVRFACRQGQSISVYFYPTDVARLRPEDVARNATSWT